jgi:aminoglycoside phosphotransferase family enzyme/predicted kinase
MGNDNQDAFLVRARRELARPEAFPVPTTSVSIAETHISLVFLTDDHVYKLKKPLRFPFLDYSTIERRRFACDEEIRLNRRLAPHVYLGVRPVVDHPAGLRIGGDGPIVDYCVEMLRLPEEALLHNRIRRRDLRDREIECLLERLAAFYRSLPRTPDLHEFADPAVFEATLHENIDTLRQAAAPQWRNLLLRMQSSQWQYLRVAEPLFRSRIADGCIVEGHGDLRPEHICLGEPPAIFDCVEFSRPFRVADVANELAFLAMECDFLGAHALGKRLLSGCADRLGDSPPPELTSFYRAYRAAVRAKVEALRAGQESGEPRRAALQRARRYLQLAADYASEFHRPVLFVTVGVSGSGKSTLAAALAAALGASVVRTDAVRRELAGGGQPDAPFQQGAYSSEMTTRTYAAVVDRARALLQSGVSVVIDGSFLEFTHRQAARDMAAAVGVPALFLVAVIPADAAKARIARRRREASDISDARPEFVEFQHSRLADARDVDADSSLQLDTTRPIEASVREIVDRLRRMGAP